jgi:hypothetical protein
MDRKFGALISRSLFRYESEVRSQVSAIVDAQQRIAARNRLLAANFERDVIAAGWHRLQSNERLTPSAVRRVIVIGAALWSAPDLDVLAAMASWPGLAPKTYVFDIDDVHTAADLDRFAPGAPLPAKTPLIAHYRDRVLRDFVQGEDGLAFVRALPSAEL